MVNDANQKNKKHSGDAGSTFLHCLKSLLGLVGFNKLLPKSIS